MRNKGREHKRLTRGEKETGLSPVPLSLPAPLSLRLDVNSTLAIASA